MRFVLPEPVRFWPAPPNPTQTRLLLQASGLNCLERRYETLKKEKAAKNKANVVGYDDVTALIKSFAKMDGKENAFRSVCDLDNNKFATYLGWGHESRNESQSPIK